MLLFYIFLIFILSFDSNNFQSNALPINFPKLTDTKTPDAKEDCNLLQLLNTDLESSVIRGIFPQITTYIKKMSDISSGNLPQIGPLIKSISHIAQSPVVKEKCLAQAHEKIISKFNMIQHKTKLEIDEIVNSLTEKKELVKSYDFTKNLYFDKVQMEIEIYVTEIEDVISKEAKSFNYNYLYDRCRHPGPKKLVKAYKEHLVDLCEKGDCFPKFVASLMEKDKSVGDDFMNIITLDGVRIQYISMFCESMVQSSADKMKTDYKEHTNLILETIESVKKTLNIK